MEKINFKRVGMAAGGTFLLLWINSWVGLVAPTTPSTLTK